MINVSSIPLTVRRQAASLAVIAALALLAGCRSSRESANPDEGFFVPLTSVPHPAAPAQVIAAERSGPSTMDRRADSLLRIQKEQEQRIGALNAQLQTLVSSRKGDRVDSSLASKKPPQPLAQAGAAFDSTKYSELLRTYEAGQFKSAVQGFRDLLERGLAVGVEEKVHYMMGMCYFKSGQFDLASASLRRVVSWKDSKLRGDAYFVLGTIYRQLGAPRQAKTMFEAVLKSSPRIDLATAARDELNNLASKK